MPRGRLLNILRAELTELLGDENIPHSAACAVTDKFISRLLQRCGGDQMLVPRVDRQRRDELIFTAWRNGEKISNIAKTHDISIRTVYNVISRKRMRRRSDDGFGSSEWNL